MILIMVIIFIAIITVVVACINSFFLIKTSNNYCGMGVFRKFPYSNPIKWIRPCDKSLKMHKRGPKSMESPQNSYPKIYSYAFLVQRSFLARNDLNLVRTGASDHHCLVPGLSRFQLRILLPLLSSLHFSDVIQDSAEIFSAFLSSPFSVA